MTCLHVVYVISFVETSIYSIKSKVTMSMSESNWHHSINKDGENENLTPPLSLRYLNEFVGKLQCASPLLQMDLFPDAKEVTEVYKKICFGRTYCWNVSANDRRWDYLMPLVIC